MIHKPANVHFVPNAAAYGMLFSVSYVETRHSELNDQRPRSEAVIRLASTVQLVEVRLHAIDRHRPAPIQIQGERSFVHN